MFTVKYIRSIVSLISSLVVRVYQCSPITTYINIISHVGSLETHKRQHDKLLQKVKTQPLAEKPKIVGINVIFVVGFRS